MTGPAELVARVDFALATFLDQRARSLAAVGPELDHVVDAARSFVLDGGKRLRPVFAYWGWRAGGATGDEDALVVAAASLELLHACALVHDDVMDASATRRGRPATHARFARLHREEGWSGDPEAFGTTAAILLGDLLLSWSDAMFASARLDPERHDATRVVFDDIHELVMAGQYLDVLVQARGEFSAADAVRVARFKTAKYTVEGPLRLGAAAGGASRETVSALTSYGLPLGEAFQLRDDILGVFGDPRRTGKPAGDDLREGKRTLLVALAMERADRAQGALLRRCLEQRQLDDETVDALLQIIVDTGALARVEQRIASRAAEAREALCTPVVDAAAAEALDALAVAASQRSA